MQQSIRYKGLSLTPDEMAVENGALSLCGNLELHDGALRPAIVSGTPLSQPLTVNGEVAKILYVHETGSYHHLIAIASSSIYWFMQDGTLGSSTPIKSFYYESTVLSIDSIGNTLIIVATDGIHYALWQDDGYLLLGQKPPFIELGFNIDAGNTPEDYDLGGIEGDGSKNGFYETFQQTTYSSNDLFSSVGSSTWKYGEICLNVKEDKQSDLTQSVYALLNRTNNLIARQGRFYANFFIRYCYRMFDGSMIMHSAPVFMPVMVPDNYSISCVNARLSSQDPLNSTLDLKDEISFNRLDSNLDKKGVKFSKAGFCYRPRNTELIYSLHGNIDELKNWNDIIKSIDVFITPPITNIDTSEKISNLMIARYGYSLSRGRELSQIWDNGEYKLGYAVIKFPTISDEAYRNKLKSLSAFYRVASLKVSDIQETKGKKLPVDKVAVYNTSMQEQMKDDYKTHNLIFANGGYSYNHRLNLYGVKEQLFKGFDRYMFPSGRKLFGFSEKDEEPSFETNLKIQKIVTVLNTTSDKKYVESVNMYDDIVLEAPMITNLVKFYPDTRAEKMVIFTTNQEEKEIIYSFDLVECQELNGAMHMGTFSNDGKDSNNYVVSSYDYSVDDVVDMSNKIYTSESDNAFYFPLNGINTVGIGTIQGIASTTRALSQGQFGQYPLMAFSTDGIWAMEVSSQGTYSSIHPISREVCSNPKSITQLDQSVLFATNRSLSRIAESQVASMSDVLDGPGFNIAGNLGKFLGFFNDVEGDDDTTKTIKAQMRQLIDFTSSPIDFFQRCQVIYDYKNSRIFCLDVSQQTKEASADTVALCYSVKDEAWSTFLIKNVLTALNSYPHPYIQYRDGSVIVLDSGYDYSDETEYHGIIVTRTLKFDEENAPDAITGYIHSLTSGTVPVMWLYGSNDNQHWHYLGRCGGMKSSYMSSHSYRFFRIALYLKMKSMNQYFATRLEVIRRFNKF